MNSRVPWLAAVLLAVLLSVTVLAGSAQSAAVVVYLDEMGVPTGYMHPQASDPSSALNLLATPPTEAAAGKKLTSAVLSGTKLIGLHKDGDATVANFSKEIIGKGLDEARMESIFQQVRETLWQFGITGEIRVLADGNMLCEYLKQVPYVAPSPQAVAESANRVVSTNSLAGRKITLSPGHGKRWNGTSWNTARPVYCSPLSQEDYHNLENAQYLETYLLQDGMTVKMVRCTDKNYGASPWAGGEQWWRMGACYWLQHLGYPGSVYGPGGTNLGEGGSDDTNEIQSRPLSSDYDGSDIYISLHTNGYTGDCSGTSCPTGSISYYDASTEHAAWATVSQNLCNSVHNAMIAAIRAHYDPAWSDKGKANSNGAYGEIRIPDRAAILIELGYHDSCDTDAIALRDNFFRSASMWGIYKGICDYFGTTPTWDFYSNEVVSHDIPAYMTVGEYYTVHVTMRNRGVLWNNAKGFKLGAVDDSDPCSTATRQTISGEVGPNSTYTFTFTLRAPLTPGTYTTDWRMVREGVAWFGPTVAQTIEVTGTPDTEAPTAPTGLSATPVSPFKVNLAWTAATDNIGVAGYKVYRDSVLIATTTGAGTTYSDNACTPGGVYVYEVSAYDGFANEGPKSSPAGATTPDSDVIDPSVPTNVVATGINTSQIDLTWTASTDNVGVTGYKIYRDGAYLTSVAGTSYSNTGLSENQTFSYAVSAYDAAGNESALSAASPATTWVTILEDGFPDIANWAAQTVADGSARGGVYDATKNHATFPGAGTISATAGASGTNGSFSARTLPGTYTSGRMEGYFYDNASSNNSRQGIWLRMYNGASLVGSTYIGCYSASPGSYSTYTVGIYTGSAWDWSGAVQARSVGWRSWRTDVLPSGTGAIKFYIDGALKGTKNRFANLDNYGISKINIGHNYNVNQQGWYDDIKFSVPVPNAPVIGTPSSVTASSIRWNFTDKADSENSFVLQDAGNAQKGTGAKNAAYINETGLAANTMYTRHVHPKNGNVEGPASASASKYTLSVAPTASTVTCDKPVGSGTSDPEFTFTAVGGFGAGKVQYYRCAWDQSPTHTWTGTEPVWSEDVAVRTADVPGSWYFHVRGYNAEDVANGSLDLGPFNFDSTAPVMTAVNDEGMYTPSTTELKADFSAADPDSGIAQYQYAIGTTAGGNDVVDWTTTTSASVTRTDLSLSAGSTYYFTVKAQNGAGIWSDAMNSDGITVAAESGKIAQVKALADGQVVGLMNKMVTARFGQSAYIEESDGSSGIRVDAAGPNPGTSASAAGVIRTSTDGERYIGDAVLKAAGSATMPFIPIVKSSYLGGADLNEATRGVTNGLGVNNIGLMVIVAGKVTHVDGTFAYIDDGAAVQDGSGYIGIRVDTSSITTTLVENKHAVVTGISSILKLGLDYIPVLKPWTDSDVRIYSLE